MDRVQGIWELGYEKDSTFWSLTCTWNVTFRLVMTDVAALAAPVPRPPAETTDLFSCPVPAFMGILNIFTFVTTPK